MSHCTNHYRYYCSKLASMYHGVEASVVATSAHPRDVFRCPCMPRFRRAKLPAAAAARPLRLRNGLAARTGLRGRGPEIDVHHGASANVHGATTVKISHFFCPHVSCVARATNPRAIFRATYMAKNKRRGEDKSATPIPAPPVLPFVHGYALLVQLFAASILLRQFCLPGLFFSLLVPSTQARRTGLRLQTSNDHIHRSRKTAIPCRSFAPLVKFSA